MVNLFTSDLLSSRQELLWEQVVRELEWRRRRAAEADRCPCRLCVNPFDDVPGLSAANGEVARAIIAGEIEVLGEQLVLFTEGDEEPF